MRDDREYSDDDLVPAATAARLIGVSRATIRKYADGGLVPVRRTPSNHRRFRVGDLREWMTPTASAEESKPPAAQVPAPRRGEDQRLPTRAGAA